MRPYAEPPRHALARLQAGFSRAMLEQGLPVPEGLAPARRFSVYRNNLYARLSDALRSRYPVVERLVGRDFFYAAAAVFIGAHPPSSPVLIEYGEAFPAFLETFEPARELPYLADTARLEWLDGFTTQRRGLHQAATASASASESFTPLISTYSMSQ